MELTALARYLCWILSPWAKDRIATPVINIPAIMAGKHQSKSLRASLVRRVMNIAGKINTVAIALNGPCENIRPVSVNAANKPENTNMKGKLMMVKNQRMNLVKPSIFSSDWANNSTIRFFILYSGIGWFFLISRSSSLPLILFYHVIGFLPNILGNVFVCCGSKLGGNEN